MGQWRASSTTGIRYPFLRDQIALGKLPTVVLVPGLYCILTNALEDWYEGLSSECLALNKDSRNPIRLRNLWFRTSGRFWLEDYAHAVTTHAINTGYLIREPCAFCGNLPSEAHHPDYGTPLRVIWLCSSCHTLHHSRLRTAEKLISETGGPAQLELIPKSWLKQQTKSNGP
jgi:hypothetical protein